MKKWDITAVACMVLPFTVPASATALYQNAWFGPCMAVGSLSAFACLRLGAFRGGRLFAALGFVCAVSAMAFAVSADSVKDIAAAVSGAMVGLLMMGVMPWFVRRWRADLAWRILKGLAFALCASLAFSLLPSLASAVACAVLYAAVGLTAAVMHGMALPGRRGGQLGEGADAALEATVVAGRPEVGRKGGVGADATVCAGADDGGCPSHSGAALADALRAFAPLLVPFMVIFFVLGTGRGTSNPYEEAVIIPVFDQYFSVAKGVAQLLVVAVLFALVRIDRRTYLQKATLVLSAALILCFCAVLLSPRVASVIPLACFTVFFYYLLWVYLVEFSVRYDRAGCIAAGGFALVMLANYAGYAVSSALRMGEVLGVMGLALLYVIFIAVSCLMLFPLSERYRDTPLQAALADGREGAEGVSDKPRNTFGAKAEVLATKRGLTERETEVMLLFCRGRSRKMVADMLSLSESTVGGHLRHVYEKAGVHSRQALLDAIEAVCLDGGVVYNGAHEEAEEDTP